MTEGKTIGNVNIFDLHKATEEAIAGIHRVGNVNILLYSPETPHFADRINMGNLNMSIEIPADADLRWTMGHLRLAPDSLQDEGSPGFHVVMGHVFVEAGPDASTEESLEGIAGLIVMGHVFCPESLAPLAQRKVKQQMGHFISYPDDAVLVTGALELTAGFLSELDKPTGFVVTGPLRAIEAIPEAIKRKVEYLRISGSILCAEENVAAIQSKLQGGSSELTVVPSEYRFHEGDLTLDGTTLGSLAGAKLFCTGTVLFGPDAEPAAIDRGLAGLRSLGLILCPETLKDAVKMKLDLVEDRAIFYAGDLWLFDQDQTLHASRFEYTEGKVTAVVTGDLRIEPDVDPAVLADRLLAVHNLGEIRCTPEQMGAIEARLGIRDGDLQDSTPEEEETFDIGNANILAL